MFRPAMMASLTNARGSASGHASASRSELLSAAKFIGVDNGLGSKIVKSAGPSDYQDFEVHHNHEK
jgi:hypothetical protein